MVNIKKFEKIAILRGGISDESEISKLTADQVFKTLERNYNVQIINVTENYKKLISDIDSFKPDVVFNCLHGYFGEDGQIQSILNYLKIPYTHSGVMTSSLCMNKNISKEIFRSLNILYPKNIKYNELEKTKKKFPIIIKPICGGSSNGLYKIKNNEDLKNFLKKNQRNIDHFLMEEFILGRELTVGILDNKVCGVMEIMFENELYDFENKYINIAKHILNPKLPKSVINKLEEISIRVHNKLNCNCISRLDFRYEEKTQNLFLLEVNTQPGLTKNSLLPEMAKEKGVDFLKLCKILIYNSKCENFLFSQQ